MKIDSNGIVRNSKNEIIGVVSEPTFKNYWKFKVLLIKQWLRDAGRAAAYAIHR
jgi:hypothetical protein